MDFISSGVLSLIGAGATSLLPMLAARILPRFLLGGALGGQGLMVFGLAFLVVGAVAGWWVTKTFWTASEVAAVNVAIAQERGNTKLVIRTETEIQTRIEKVRVIEKELIHAEPIIITREVEAACPTGLPTGFVRLHDSAAASKAPGPASESDTSPAGVTLAQANSAIRENYTEYHICRQQVIGWNVFYSCLRQHKEEDEVASCVSRELNRLGL